MHKFYLGEFYLHAFRLIGKLSEPIWLHTYNSKLSKKFYYKHIPSHLTVEDIKCKKFHLQNCLVVSCIHDSRTNVCCQNCYFEKIPITSIIMNHLINKFYHCLLSFSLTVEHVLSNKFRLWNWKWVLKIQNSRVILWH